MKNNKNKSTNQQGDKFIATARELGCDESESAFNEKLGKLAQHKPVEETKDKK